MRSMSTLWKKPFCFSFPPENSRIKDLIRPENSAASNCSYGRKIPASNYQIRPENSASCNYRNGWKIPARNTRNVIAHCTQGCSGAVVEYLFPNLKVEGLCPPCAQILFRYTAGNFRWRRKLNRKFRPTCQKLFCSMYEMSQRHPVWVAENHVTAYNSVQTI